MFISSRKCFRLPQFLVVCCHCTWSGTSSRSACRSFTCCNSSGLVFFSYVLWSLRQCLHFYHLVSFKQILLSCLVTTFNQLKWVLFAHSRQFGAFQWFCEWVCDHLLMERVEIVCHLAQSCRVLQPSLFSASVLFLASYFTTLRKDRLSVSITVRKTKQSNSIQRFWICLALAMVIWEIWVSAARLDHIFLSETFDLQDIGSFYDFRFH